MAFGVGASIGEAFVVVRPDTRGFQGEAKRGILGPLKGVAIAAGAAFAAVGVGSFIKDTISQASDLNETVTKTQIVFGGSAASVLKFGNTAAKSLGQSKNTALGAAATFGNLFRAMQIGQAPAAKMSTSLVTLAGDLASFNNVSPEEALEALRSGLVGETEPLRRFGVQLSAARVQEEALRLGLGKSKETLTASAKAQAAYSLIMKDTALAQGDFERTSGGLANQQRILSAQFTDLKASIGKALLPVITGAVSFINSSVLPAFGALGKAFKSGDVTEGGLLGVFQRIGVAAKVFIGFVRGTILPGVRALIGAFQDPDVTSDGFAGVMERIGSAARGVVDFLTQTVAPALGKAFSVALPVIQAVVGRLSAVLGGLFRNFLPAVQAVGAVLGKVFGPAFQAVTQAVLPAAAAFGQALLPALRSLVNTFKNDVLPVLKVVGIVIGVVLFIAFAKVVPVILRLVGVVLRFAGPVLGFLLKAVGFVIGRVFGLVGVIGRLVGAFFRATKGPGVLGQAFRALMTVARVVWGVISTVVRTAFGVVSTVVKVISNLLRGNFRQAFQIAQDAVNSAMAGVVRVMRSLPGKILRALGAVGSLLLQVGKDIITGLVQGITDGIGNVVEAVGRVIGGIPGFAKKLLGIGSPSKVMRGIGANVGKGLALGMEDSRRAVTGAAGRLAGSAVAIPRRGGALAVTATGAASGGAGVTQNFTLVQQPGQSPPAFISQAMFAARTQMRPA